MFCSVVYCIDEYPCGVVVVILTVPSLGDLSCFEGDDMTQGVGEVLLFSSFPRHGEWEDVYRESCLKMEDQDDT